MGVDPGDAYFPRRGIFRHFLNADDVHGDEQAERDGESKMAALLEHVGGREIDRDALGRQRQAHGADCAAHAFARFTDRLVRQTDDGKARQASRDADLHIHVERLDALKGDRVDMGDHAAVLPQ